MVKNTLNTSPEPRKSVSVAQLDARLTGDQEVVGSTPAEVGNIFHGDWSWNIFYYWLTGP